MKEIIWQLESSFHLLCQQIAREDSLFELNSKSAFGQKFLEGNIIRSHNTNSTNGKIQFVKCIYSSFILLFVISTEIAELTVTITESIEYDINLPQMAPTLYYLNLKLHFL